MGSRTLRGKTVLLDCRWLGLGGAGRATELLLRGLRASPPEGRWVLWGPAARRIDAWPGAEWRTSRGSPRRLWGQGEAVGMPPHDVAIFMHQIRPLVPGRSVTLLHDTIALRQATDPVTRTLKRAFLRRVARVSDRILTVSEHSRRTILRDLGVPAAKIGMVRYPVDAEMAERVRALRSELPQRDVGLYVGRFARHKNLNALVTAFQATSFRARGGRLALVGGSPAEVRQLTAYFRREGIAGVAVEGPRPQAALEEAYATSRFLVMPSLEEGFGLPVWEAMACGLPVCVSDGGALPEITDGVAVPFPARSIDEMAAAIDRTAERRPAGPVVLSAPSLGEYAAAFVAQAENALGRS